MTKSIDISIRLADNGYIVEVGARPDRDNPFPMRGETLVFRGGDEVLNLIAERMPAKEISIEDAFRRATER